MASSQPLLNQLVDTLSSGLWSQALRIVPLICHLQRRCINNPSDAVGNAQSPGVVYLRNPFHLSQFGYILLALDWPNLTTASDIVNMITKEFPSETWDTLSADSQLVAECFILTGVFLMIYHNKSEISGFSNATRKHLLESIDTGNLSIIKQSRLPTGTWRMAFGTRSLRLEAEKRLFPPEYEWEVVLNSTLDAIRVSSYHDRGFLIPTDLVAFLAQGPQSTKVISQALATSYYFVLEYANTSPNIVSSNLEFLAVFSNDLPAVWFSQRFSLILTNSLEKSLDSTLDDNAEYCIRKSCLKLLSSLVRNTKDEGYRYKDIIHLLHRCATTYSSQGRTHLIDMAVITLVSLAAHAHQPLHDDLLVHIEESLLYPSISEDLLRVLALLISNLSSISSRRILFAMLRPRNSKMGADSKPERSLEELALISKFIASADVGIVTFFDSALNEIYEKERGWRGWFTSQPKFSPEWIPDLLNTLLGIEPYSNKSGLDDTNIESFGGVTESELFAAVGLLEALLQRKAKGQRISQKWIEGISIWILSSMRVLYTSDHEKLSFVFSRGMKALPEVPTLSSNGTFSASWLQQVSADGVIMTSLETLLTHPDCMSVSPKILELDNSVKPYSPIRSVTGLNAAVLASALSKGIRYFYYSGNHDALEEFHTRICQHVKALFNEYETSLTSGYNLDNISANTKDTDKTVLQRYTRVLMICLVLLEGIQQIALDCLEKYVLFYQAIPSTVMNVVAISLVVLSHLHFVTCQFGIGSVDLWTQRMDVFSAILSRSPNHAVDALNKCMSPIGPNIVADTPTERSRVLFYLILAGRLFQSIDTTFAINNIFPVARRYLLLGRDPWSPNGEEPSADLLDLFDSSHSLYLKIFENSALYQLFACRIAPEYVGILLKLFPKYVDHDMLLLCFSTVMNGLGQMLFSTPIESPSVLIHHSSQQGRLATNMLASEEEEMHSPVTVNDRYPLEKYGTATRTEVEISDMVERMDTDTRAALEVQAEVASQECISLLFRDIFCPSNFESEASGEPLELSHHTGDTTTESRKGRLNELLAVSGPTTQFLQSNQLITILFAQLRTVSLTQLPGLMEIISNLLIGNDERHIEGYASSSPHSTLWQELFKVVSDDRQVDYTRRIYVVEWYMRLHDRAIQKIANTHPLPQADHSTPSDLKIMAKL
ncbi:hypothetical protein BASA50_006620 [Batrachochytrium salamandrivorans]|uniref:Uncharacterized protein n=1 Tax=Batrachochytrium salamandrivorans TaxID=1357716 RepID=A0ABQ8F968_9FUNG|nr:hypothetical protein BASA50_006620 [Batrachochytrium salamandrivorans]